MIGRIARYVPTPFSSGWKKNLRIRLLRVLRK